MSGRTRLSFYRFSRCNKSECFEEEKNGQRIIAFAALEKVTTAMEEREREKIGLI